MATNPHESSLSERDPQPTTSLVLCDDTPDIREFLGLEMAQHADLTVVGEATNGMEAVEQARRLQPDVMVLDLAMPLLDGFEALPRILAVAPHTKVVAFSGLDRKKAEPLAIAQGATAFIEKGDALHLIVDKIREVRGALRGAHGDVVGSSGITTDISDRLPAEREVDRSRRELEDRVRERTEELEDRTRQLEAKTKQLEESMRELDAFAYTVSHDLRAPLRAMDGFSRILLDDYVGDMDPAAARYLGFIRSNAQGMQDLVDGLLAFSRLGRRALKRVALSPTVLARQALSDLGPLTERDGLEIQIDPDLPECSADPTLLKQVYVNLIGNAIKFSRHTAEGRIRVGGMQDGEQTVYSVSDNGVGFEPEYAEKIFGLFERLHRAEEFEGTGIGLANVLRIVDKHDGRIWCESEPDAGRHSSSRSAKSEADDGPDTDPPRRGQPQRPGARPPCIQETQARQRCPHRPRRGRSTGLPIQERDLRGEV